MNVNSAAIFRCRSQRLASAPQRRQHGSSLLEVLIAIVVISAGLLGLAGLQLAAVQSSHSAYQRSQATLLAYDMIDRMRTMRTATEAGRFDEGSDHAERVAWDTLLTRTLGASAVGNVERVGESVTVTVTWDDSRGEVRHAGNAADDELSLTYGTEI